MKNVVAVIPVKRLVAAKSRLASVLLPRERQVLVECMLHDVLDAISASTVIDEIIVATADISVLTMARHRGATVFNDRWESGVARVVTEIALELEGRARTMMTIPADVPLITATEVERLVSSHGDRRGVTVVPASKDGGSNALLTSSPAVIPFQYGRLSSVKHYEAATERRVSATIVSLVGFETDIDTPDDLRTILVSAPAGHTVRYLSHISVTERLQLLSPAGGHNHELAAAYV